MNHRQRKRRGKRESVIKVTRWEEKLFNALVGENEKICNEREIGKQLNYFYQRMDTQDLITAGSISDISDNYQLLADLGLQSVFALYCAKGKDFDQVFFKNEMVELGFHKFFAHKVWNQLEVWRNTLPLDITEEEMQAGWTGSRRLPDSVVYLEQQ
jgi:hypothetical protein